MDWIIIAHGKTDKHIFDDEHEYGNDNDHSIDSDVDYYEMALCTYCCFR